MCPKTRPPFRFSTADSSGTDPGETPKKPKAEPTKKTETKVVDTKAGDTKAGDTKGQGVGDVWWMLSPDGQQIKTKS